MKRSKAYAFINAVKRIRQTLSDEVALANIALFPDWEAGKTLSVGDKVEYEEKLYKVVQAHTTQESWTPNLTPALFEPIDIVNDGTLENPIVAVSGMTYYKDKYYFDETDNKIYLCIRQDTEDGTVLHFMPNSLIDIYFTLAI